MKDPLEYTLEELKNLSTEELTKLKELSDDLASKYDTEQMTKKILINAMYGATGNLHFPLYNRDYASGITANGRIFIQQTANMLREKFQELIPWDKEYIIYGDTDSSFKNTIIKTDKGDITIGDLYDKSECPEIEYKPGKFIKEVKNLNALSVNKEFKAEYKPIKYVMKHKVNKRLFKIKCNGNEVIITKDHSVMVKRNNELVEAKPGEIQKGDKLILVTENDD